MKAELFLQETLNQFNVKRHLSFLTDSLFLDKDGNPIHEINSFEIRGIEKMQGEFSGFICLVRTEENWRRVELYFEKSTYEYVENKVNMILEEIGETPLGTENHFVSIEECQDIFDESPFGKLIIDNYEA